MWRAGSADLPLIEWYIKLDYCALWLVRCDRDASIELREQALDHLEAQARSRLVHIEIRRQAHALIRHHNMQLGSAPFASHLDFAGLVGVGMLRRVRDKLVDEEAKRNCRVRRNHQVVEVAVYLVGERFLQLPAKLACEVGNIDKPDPSAAPQVIVNLGDRGDAGGRVLECVLNFLGLRAARLDPEQPHHRRQAVFDSVAHLSGQHGLVLEGFLELGVGMLPLDGDAEQARKARKEIGIREIELTRVRAVDFQNAER